MSRKTKHEAWIMRAAQKINQWFADEDNYVFFTEDIAEMIEKEKPVIKSNVKVFIVMEESGQWDDAWQEPVAVFSSIKKAHTFIDQEIKKAKRNHKSTPRLVILGEDDPTSFSLSIEEEEIQ